MEFLGFVEVPWWIWAPVFIILMLVGSLYGYTTYKQSTFQRHGIPIGPKPVPFFGLLPYIKKKGILYLDAEFIQKYGKCFGIYIGNRPSLIVSDPEMIKMILVKEFSSFTDRQMSPLLNKCLKSLCDVLDRKYQESGILNMVEALGAFTMDVICSTAFGVDVDSQNNPGDPFVRNAAKFNNFSIGSSKQFTIAMLFPDFEFIYKHLFTMLNPDAMNFFKTAVTAILNDRRSQKEYRPDLLQVMLNSFHESNDEKLTLDEKSFEEFKKRGMTDDEIIINSMVFMLAGYETTATTLTWVSYCLATHQDVQQQLIEEIRKGGSNI